MQVVELKTLTKERGLRDYSRLNKAELIACIPNNLQPCTRPPKPTGPKDSASGDQLDPNLHGLRLGLNQIGQGRKGPASRDKQNC